MFLFNDVLNTFYLRLYGFRRMVKDHSDSERGNPLLPNGLLFLINSKSSFMCHPTDRIYHTTAFVTPVVEHWLEREITQWVHHEESIRWPIAPWVDALTTELHLAPILFHDCRHLVQVAQELNISKLCSKLWHDSEHNISYTTKEGKKEIFYLMTHLPHFIYSYMVEIS